jgi:protein-S-isoprenylcysteine O-methyltransferase Ste14
MAFTTIGIILMTLLSSARLAQALAGQWWALPLLAHSLLAAILLILHGESSNESPLLQQFIAWCSALLPLTIHLGLEIPMMVRLLSLIGVVFAVWGLASLGKAFDIAPADRGLVIRGPYRFMRHPIYAGELFSVLVMTLTYLSLWNGIAILLLVVTLILRIQWEEKIINGYADYARHVPSRLVPGLW